MSVSKMIERKIKRKPKGTPFSSSELGALGSYANIRKVLSRLEKANEITRIAHGVYYRPQTLPYVLPFIPGGAPTPKAVIETIAKSTGETIGISGAEAAQRLGLTTQMQMKVVFYTTGYSRTIKIGNLEVLLKHVSPRKLAYVGTALGLVITALQYLGKENVSRRTIALIRRRLGIQEFEYVLKNIHHMPGWMSDIFRQFKEVLGHV